MPLYLLIVLALVQGITEFLPISSSGHLVLIHNFMGDGSAQEHWNNALVMDVAVHVGTLFSVLVYFHRDITQMFSGLAHGAKGSFAHSSVRLNINIIAASIPVIIAGLIMHLMKPDFMRMVEIIGWTSIIFGVLLWFADQKQGEKTVEELSLKDAFLIGLAQALALIPGTSRSGVTMSAARYLGYSRSESARFSLLLAIVAISGAGVLAGKDLVEMDNVRIGFDALIAAILAFISGWVSIALMMRWLAKASFTPFVIYRVVLGAVLLGFTYSGVI